MQQEIFSFHKIENLDWCDFIDNPENSEAISYLTKWPNWISDGLIIYGESGVGKTHLAALWAQTTNAIYLLQEAFNHDPRDLFDSDCNFVMDNFDGLLGAKNHDWIFHFLNIINEKKKYFLILSRTPPIFWNVSLDDLKSRLLSVPSVNIPNPSDESLLKIARKISNDLGIIVPDEVLSYILKKIDRCVRSVSDVLKILDKLSMQQKKPITLAFVKSQCNFS
jgi:chromosomal replication initiation ATPase DnaA